MAKMLTDRIAVFSIKPKFAKLIMQGTKTVELRRTTPRQIEKGSLVLFWESSPQKQLVGCARVTLLAKQPVSELWDSISECAGISRDEFDDYFQGADFGVAVFLADAEEFSVKLSLQELRDELGFMPPQSFRYLSQAEHDFLRDSAIIGDSP